MCLCNASANADKSNYTHTLLITIRIAVKQMIDNRVVKNVTHAQ